ncbi:MAG TPA: hypothetical protein VH601_02480 [Bryobacteraceae bacterium]|jgi:hypothetical protein
MQASLALDEILLDQVKTALHSLVAYCRASDWAGHDPYDALNSRVFEKLPFLHSRTPRIILTQLLKRSPVNVRPALLVPKTQNPKALALFLSAFVKVADAGIADCGNASTYLAERLVALRSSDQRYWCWGYSFPWQTRTVIVPSGAPNLVCTTFVADALLDAYEYYGNPQYLTMSTSAAEYIVNNLYWHNGDSVAGFAYPLPTVRNQVHNANLLAAALLCRVSRHTGEQKFLSPALAAARFSASRQNPDGSWRYGEAPSQHFVDNFHTGFNLCALHSIMRELRSDEFEEHVNRGFRYYRDHFYLPNGSVRYFHNRTYPIDIHAVAQSIITPAVLSDFSPSNITLAASVFRWAMTHMWNARGYFYYRVLRYATIRIPYMRWSQAWMAHAIAQLLWTLTKQAEIARQESFVKTGLTT